MYIDKLDDIMNKCNNTYHRTIKMNPADVTSTHILTLIKKIIRKTLKKIFTVKKLLERFAKKTIKKSLNRKSNQEKI